MMLADLTALIADATESARGPGAGLDFVMLLLAPLALFMLFIFMPMRREARVRKEMLSKLKVGDWVVLNGSAVARVAQIVPADKRVG
jgi:preprotein translocase subunit YajC